MITNHHIIQGAKTISAETLSGASYQCEGILLEPPDSDLAVLKFKARGVEKLTFGTMSRLTEGQKVVVIGNPEGLAGTVSEVIISAFRDNPRLVQITAPISPGSSGSPVLDDEGQVIGIATLIYKEGQNLNFAIPADEIIRVLASIPKETQLSPVALKPDAGATDADQQAADLQAIGDLQKQQKDSEALQAVAEFLRNHQDNAKAWSLKAQLLSGLNLATEAVEAQKTTTKLDPDNAGAWADLAFYQSLVAGYTPKPNGIGTEIRSSAEHALALGDDREMTWDLLVWACKTMGDAAGVARYAATRDEKINQGQLNLRTQALANLIPGDYKRIDLDDYVAKHSLTLALESKRLVVRGGPKELNFSVIDPSVSIGHALLSIDVFPRKSKNGHWYISEYTKTKVLEPALRHPGLGVELLPSNQTNQKAYLAVWPGVKKEEETVINDWIRQIIALDPNSFANFSEWKPETSDAVVIFCSVIHQSWPTNIMGSGLFSTGLFPQAPVGTFRTERNVDWDLQRSALLQICMQSALPGKWAFGGTMITNTTNAPPVRPDCPTIYCSLDFNDKLPGAEKQKAKNDAKTAFVKGLRDFNTELLLIAASEQK